MRYSTQMILGISIKSHYTECSISGWRHDTQHNDTRQHDNQHNNR
jgi:hypothetical protein